MRMGTEVNRPERTTPESGDLPLTELRRGDVAVIRVLGGTPAFQARLRNMGVREGEEIVVIKSAPLADPIEYCLGGMHISLRRREAREIWVGEVQPGQRPGGGRRGRRCRRKETGPGECRRRWFGWR